MRDKEVPAVPKEIPPIPKEIPPTPKEVPPAQPVPVVPAAPSVPVLPQETEILVVEADDARSEEVDDVYGGVEEVEHIKPKDDDTLSTHSSFAGGMAL